MSKGERVCWFLMLADMREEDWSRWFEHGNGWEDASGGPPGCPAGAACQSLCCGFCSHRLGLITTWRGGNYSFISQRRTLRYNEVKQPAQGQVFIKCQPGCLLICSAALQKFAAKTFRACLLINPASLCQIGAKGKMMGGHTDFGQEYVSSQGCF